MNFNQIKLFRIMNVMQCRIFQTRILRKIDLSRLEPARLARQEKED
jgi:hypothetical protein